MQIPLLQQYHTFYYLHTYLITLFTCKKKKKSENQRNGAPLRSMQESLY